MMSDSPLIELEDVSHRFGQQPCLNDNNWVIQPGEHWGIIGPSGAGKTTLLKIVAGYLWPNVSGNIRRHGQKEYNLSKWRRKIGWLSTDLSQRIPSNQTVYETVLAGSFSQTRLAERKDLSFSENMKKQARSLLQNFHLHSKSHKPFHILSQGETQLILIARALMADPFMLILDEPCAGMDPGKREHFLSYLETTTSNYPSVSILYVTHHIEEFVPSISKLLALKEGKTLASGPLSEHLSADLLAELFDFPFELIQKNGRYWPLSASEESAPS